MADPLGTTATFSEHEKVLPGRPAWGLQGFKPRRTPLTSQESSRALGAPPRDPSLPPELPHSLAGIFGIPTEQGVSGQHSRPPRPPGKRLYPSAQAEKVYADHGRLQDRLKLTPGPYVRPRAEGSPGLRTAPALKEADLMGTGGACAHQRHPHLFPHPCPQPHLPPHPLSWPSGQKGQLGRRPSHLPQAVTLWSSGLAPRQPPGQPAARAQPCQGHESRRLPRPRLLTHTREEDFLPRALPAL